MPSHYKYHVFVCTNQRDELMSCSDFDALNARAYLKKEIKRRGIDGEGKVRVNQAGCLGRCLSGPVMVIYPEETWYTYVDESDLDDILDQHLEKGQRVERLLIDTGPINQP